MTVWGPDRFIYPEGRLDDGDEIDLAGRVRIVSHGPYESLPEGDWRAVVRFRIDAVIRPVFLRFEWGGPDMTPVSVQIDAAGVYSMTLDHHWRSREFAELRIWVERPTFSGRLALIEVTVEPRGPD